MAAVWATGAAVAGVHHKYRDGSCARIFVGIVDHTLKLTDFLFLLEESMRRRHCSSRIWGSVGCDAFCKLWWVSVRGCVGTVVGLYGSWRFLAILCRFFTVFLADSAMCVALQANTAIEYRTEKQ